MSEFDTGGKEPNTIEKADYHLEFNDEFAGDVLDLSRWLPFHLPQWSSRQLAAARHRLAGGHLSLDIEEKQAPWCPEFDGDTLCSSLQTGVYAGPLGSEVGQHRFNKSSVVREAQQGQQTYAPLYGYFEMRARAVANPENHVALWMIGYEDTPVRSAEICICEIFGKHVEPSSARIGYGIHPWADASLVDEFREAVVAIDATTFHIYAAEWKPGRVEFFVDNQLIGTVDQSPDYPMQFMLGIYERPGARMPGRATASSYPKSFVVDYFRAYRPIGGYKEAFSSI